MVAMREMPSQLSLTGGTLSLNPIDSNGDAEQIFKLVLNALRKKLSLFVWQGFFEPLMAKSFDADILTLLAPSSFHKDWVCDHYLIELVSTTSEVLGRKIKIVVTCEGEQDTASKRPKERPKRQRVLSPEPKAKQQAVPYLIESNSLIDEAKVVIDADLFNPSYTFDSFVEGPSNEMGFAACNAVSQQPGKQYSPLFIFGSAGLGKTHLLHAIGLTAQRQHPKLRVVLMSAEQWVNSYIRAIREKQFDQFRKKFRFCCDLLLIDDIQFLAGKDASQDEFFHTFNSLHQMGKQIVVTSDKYPHEISGLENRIQTRLSWGLIADIRPPEVKTRVAILYKKANKLGVNLPSDVADYLASQVSTSVRELEGALNRICAFASLSKTEITLAKAREFFGPLARRSPTQVTADQICEKVAAHYELSIDELKGKNRQQKVSQARQVAMSLCRTMLSLSFPEIGRFFARDHTTVMSSIKKIEKLKITDSGILHTWSNIESRLLTF